MATATAKAPKQFTVRFELTGNDVEDAEPWNVYAPDGSFETCRETEAEALAYAAEANETLVADTAAAEEAEREELIVALQEKIGDMDLGSLRKLAKRLLD